MSSYVYPDPDMQGLLNAARRLSSSPSPSKPSSSARSSADSELRAAVGNSRPGSRTELLLEAKRPSAVDNLIMEEQRRRLSEAGVNRRPSAAQVLTEDTDSFIIGMRVYVDGVKPGRIQFIGDTKFGPGEWAGVFLDEPIGKRTISFMGVMGYIRNISYFNFMMVSVSLLSTLHKISLSLLLVKIIILTLISIII